ncbi:MAG: CNNM domain-containing protein, partial [Candidatus Omnitrophica bacterium]|nr:CNNM domain-containing protein [Candidatus Omnitrophota bacterium]
EACLLSLSLADIARISEKRPAVAQTWKIFRENIQRPITVILIINTLAHTIGAALSGAKFDELFGTKWVFIFSLVFSFIMIQWTEILPKTLGVRYNRNVALIAGMPLKFLITVFTPFVGLVQFLNRPFAGKKEEGKEAGAVEDISVLAKFAALQKTISVDQERILSRTVKLQRIKVSDIMVKRDEIKFLSTKMSLADALIEAHIHHHTRLPLIEGDNLDKVIGYINFKDIVSALQTNPKDPSLKGISRPVMEVRENEQLSGLLNKLTGGYQHIAVVRDDAGNISGLVTLEDVIESLVGEMQDEYDILPTYFYQIAVNRYLAGGGIKLKDLPSRGTFGLPGDERTLNEWFLDSLGRMPKVEDRICHSGNVFIARKVRRSNIFEVIIETDIEK